MKSDLCIVGGGTAGYVAALVLKTKYPHLNINLIKSDKIGIIGVGEGSTPHWDTFIKTVGITADEIIRECGVTLKTSIYYKNWGHKDYIHSVDNSIMKDYFNTKIKLLYKFYNNYSGIHIGPVEHLAKQLNGEVRKPVNQFHFDNLKLNTFLKKKSEERGVNVIDDEITEVHTGEHGIHSVKGKVIYHSNFWIDATGFKKLLMSKLNAKWIGVDPWLSLNTAITYRTYKDEVPDLWTEAHALSAGWKFKVPLQDKQGNGYIFDSNYLSEDEAMEEINNVELAAKDNIRTIRFTAGYLEETWKGNCFAIGLTGSFFEPLEASSIATSIQQSFMLATNLINYDQVVIDRYNKQFIKLVENIRDFLILHYRTKRTDTKFWRDKASMDIPDSLAAKLEIVKSRLLTKDDFDDGHYALWRDQHYAIVMYGMGLLDQDMVKSHYEALPEAIKKQLFFEKNDEVDQQFAVEYIYHDKWLQQVRKGERVVDE